MNTIRLSRKVVYAFRATGSGWQRMKNIFEEVKRRSL
ncbi:MAG: BrnA antitoxin family protein [Nitrosomonas sp.]|nr:BrnA antitoxin family protein [Nitrosomonas sp.]